MDWSTHFPAFKLPEDSTVETTNEHGEKRKLPQLSKQVEIADIGCGFGGLIVALSPLYPDTLMIGKSEQYTINIQDSPSSLFYHVWRSNYNHHTKLTNTKPGMELRTQVTDFVINRIAALRSQHPSTSSPTTTNPSPPAPYQNISALRTNTMKFLPNHFNHHQLRSIFLCFPDPHFKQRKHKARIVSPQLAAEYAYVLRPGGKVYTITDVQELHEWMVRHFVGVEAGDVKGLWERVGEEEVEDDEMVGVMMGETEEGKKVSRNGGGKFVAVFRRGRDPDWVEGAGEWDG